MQLGNYYFRKVWNLYLVCNGNLKKIKNLKQETIEYSYNTPPDEGYCKTRSVGLKIYIRHRLLE